MGLLRLYRFDSMFTPLKQLSSLVFTFRWKVLKIHSHAKRES